MREYTFSRARQEFASVLDQARREGGVLIRRRDGQLFEIKPAAPTGRSPLEVPAIDLGLPAGEMLAALSDSRASGERFVKERPTQRRRK
jgi:hypothetical protein